MRTPFAPTTLTQPGNPSRLIAGETLRGPVTPEERIILEAERSDLQRKAVKRRDMPGFAANVAAIDERIAEIDVLLAQPDDEPE